MPGLNEILEALDGGSRRVLSCLGCKRYVKPGDGWYNMKNQTVVCEECVSEISDEVELEFGCWELLNLNPKDATPATVRRAFGKAAFECHPDKFPGDEEKADMYAALTDARDEALDILRKKGAR